jgi:4-amino-4-deoxy-L-arabinose transferase-like glycosyltransferase
MSGAGNARLRAFLQTHRALLTALLVALVLRLAWISFYDMGPPRGDDKAYVNLAHSMLEGRGYTSDGNPITHYMPGWPLVIAVPLGLGLGLTGVRILLCLASTLVCLEAYLLGHMLVSRRAGLAAAWFGALFPPLIWYSGVALSEVPSAALFGLWAVMAVRYVQGGGRLGRIVALGLVTGLLNYLRAEMVVLAPLPFVARAVSVSGDRLRELLRGALGTALALLCLVPWAAYNHHRFGEVVLLTTAGGPGLWVVANDPQIPDFSGPEFDAGASRFRVPGHPKQTDANFAAEARTLIRQNPAGYLRRRIFNLPRFWLGSQSEPVPGAEKTLGGAMTARDWKALILKSIGFFAQTALVVGAFVGLLLFARRRERLLPWLVIGAKVAAHAPFVQATRYSMHLAPLLLCYAGATLAWLVALRAGEAEPVATQARVTPVGTV